MRLRCVLLSLGILLPLSLVAQDEQSKPSYKLPFEAGKTLTCGAGNGVGTHTGEFQFGFDFLMPIGTRVCASRSGTVIDVREDDTDKDSKTDGNYVAIAHADGTEMMYGHLTKNGVLVKVGDKVYQGDVIALSGASGPVLNPALHIHLVVTQGRKPVEFTFDDLKGGSPRRGTPCRSGNNPIYPPQLRARIRLLSRTGPLALRLGGYALAYSDYKELSALKLPFQLPEIEQARAKLKEIEAIVKALVDRAGQVSEKEDATKVIADLSHAQKAFGRSGPGKNIAKALKTLRKHPSFGPTIKSIKQTLKNQAALLRALSSDVKGDATAALRAYKRCAEDDPEGRFGQLAAGRAAEIEQELENAKTK